MAYPVVQTIGGSTATSTPTYTLGFTANVTAGNLLIFVGAYVTAIDVTSLTTLTDPNNTWTKATAGYNPGTAEYGCEIWYCLNCAGGHMDTVVYSTGGGGVSPNFLQVTGQLFEVGGSGATALDTVATVALGNNSGPAQGNDFTALTSPYDFVMYAAMSNEVALTAITGWNVWYTNTDAPVVYQLAPNNTYVTAPVMTVATGIPFFTVVGAAFKGTAGGSGPGVVTGTVTLSLGPLTVTATGSPAVTGITGTAVLNLGPFTISADDTARTRTGYVALEFQLVVSVVAGRVGPGGFPVPGYRGRWRLTLHNRAFAPATLASTIIAELADARGRQIIQTWNTPATLTFTLDGHSQSAALIQELMHDVVAWRWDDQTGLEQPVFRGPICQSEDQLTSEAHTVTYTCHDYAALFSRRLLTGIGPYSVTNRDQDLIVSDLLAAAVSAQSSSGVSFSPASFLPVSLLAANPDGSLRGLSGQLRNRTYYGSQNIGEAVNDLSKIIGGFDYDVRPSAVDDHDSLRVFYPAQGVNRTDIALQYGSTVASLTRTVNSADYANYVRVLGNNTSATPTPQLYGEDWGPTALATTTPVGLWMLGDDAADVTVQSTLNEKASGTLALDTILVPSYTLGLAPNAYTWGNPNMGDTVGLVIQSGRLNVNTFPPSGGVRVLGITYDIGDDGQEDVILTVSRPRLTFRQLVTSADRDIKALARR